MTTRSGPTPVRGLRSWISMLAQLAGVPPEYAACGDYHTLALSIRLRVNDVAHNPRKGDS